MKYQQNTTDIRAVGSHITGLVMEQTYQVFFILRILRIVVTLAIGMRKMFMKGMLLVDPTENGYLLIHLA